MSPNENTEKSMVHSTLYNCKFRRQREVITEIVGMELSNNLYHEGKELRRQTFLRKLSLETFSMFLIH
jgi:hypothetical protein